MALIACRECKKEVSDNAEHCPHCGVRVAPKQNKAGCGTVLVALITGLIIISAIGSLTTSTPAPAPTPTPAQAKSDGDRTARYACKGFIEKSLHDPASADLSNWTQALVTNPSANSSIFEVAMRVRAKNAFNAMRLSTMVCRMERSGDHWTLMNLVQIP